MSNLWPKIKSFNTRWEIDNKQEEWNKIINRFLAVIDKHLSDWWCEFERIECLEQEFCCYMGLEYQELEPEEQYNYYGESNDYIFKFEDTHLYTQIKSAHDNKSLAKVLQYMFIVLEEKIKLENIRLEKIKLEEKYMFEEIKLEEEIKKLKENLFFGSELELLELAPLTPLYEEIKALAELHQCFSITKVQISVTIYPYGSPLLDEQVINKTLEELKDYQEIYRAFDHALKIYESAETEDYPEEKYRDAQDNLRLALEQLLKKILDNDRGLEKQIIINNTYNKEEKEHLKKLKEDSDLGILFKEKKVSTRIENILCGLLDPYITYLNEQVKHRDKAKKELFTKPEVEFIIYLTGTIIRFLIQIKKSSD